MELFCLGDSLTFGYGVSRGESWPALVQQESGAPVFNRGVCGDTTGGMLARLDRDVLAPIRLRGAGACRAVVMGGSNDILLAGDDAAARANLGAICHQLLAEVGPPLVGIPLPVDSAHIAPQWAGVADFALAARRMAEYSAWLRGFCRSFGLAAVDFPLDFQEEDGRVRSRLLLDGLHPTPEGHRKMARRLLEQLRD